MSNKNICIIGAMDCEITILKSLLKNTEEIKHGLLTFYKGEMYGKSVVIVQSGVGKVCAAICTQILADKFNPACVINTGIAGGIGKGLQIGDIIIADKLVYHDFDATAIGYAKGYICNNTNSQEPTYFYTDKSIVEKTEKIISQKMHDINHHRGVVASGDMFVGTKERKDEIRNLFNAIAAEMEGAAIAHTCNLNNIPCIIIRAISDLADEETAKGHAFVEEETANKSAEIIKALVENID